MISIINWIGEPFGIIAAYRKKFESALINKIFDIYDKHKKFGLKDRVGQVDMSLDISEAYVNSRNIIIEAGVGIGKSFGYLIPALLINEYSGKPVIVATSSIQLSEQLLRDIDVISYKLNFNKKAVVGKGMNHYACRLQAMRIFEDASNKFRFKNSWWLIKKVAEGKIDERSNISQGINDKQWKQVCVNKCIFEKCEYKSDCSFYKMRYEISDYSSDVDFVIVNQDLLIRDIIRKNETGKGFIISRPAMLVIDEAHNFENKVRNALTDIFTQSDIEVLLQDIIKILAFRIYDKEIEDRINTIININEVLFQNINGQIEEISSSNDSDLERYKISPPTNIDIDALDNILHDVFVSISVFDPGKREREIDDALEKLNALRRIFHIFKGTETNYLIWATKSINNEVSLNACPKQIQTILEENLFNQEFNVVLTSATLCQNGHGTDEKYDYIKKSLGFVGDLSEPKPSPFDYTNHGLLYIVDDLPHYKTEKRLIFLDAAFEKIIKLCNLTFGRTLVLFTAKEDLKYIMQKFSGVQTNWERIVQSEGANQEQALNKFKETHGVLFGTGVFWEGINIVGDDLSQVIIVRLPFPVPNDPIIEYKVSQAKDAFQEIMLPEMLIRLRQGVGRLIRSETDTGLLTILDSRLSEKYNKKYREAVLSSLPFKTVTESFDEVRTFVESKILSLTQ